MFNPTEFNQLIPQSYILFLCLREFKTFTLECRKNEEDGRPIAWAVCNGQSTCMSKENGMFFYETLPSNRDEQYFKEFRFATPEEAFECWLKHKDKHIAPYLVKYGN